MHIQLQLMKHSKRHVYMLSVILGQSSNPDGITSDGRKHIEEEMRNQQINLGLMLTSCKHWEGLQIQQRCLHVTVNPHDPLFKPDNEIPDASFDRFRSS